MDKLIKVSVRNIVEFALKSGSIDSGFSGRNVAIEGTRGHRAVQKLRQQEQEEYLCEVPIAYEVREGNIILEISGRIDGFFMRDDIGIIEEIKTTERQLEAIDENFNPLHIAQAKFYAYMYCCLNSMDKIGIQMTYYHRATKAIKSFIEIYDKTCLEEFFIKVTSKYLKWADINARWSEERDCSIGEINFPFETYRKGQREFAVAAYRTITEGKKLFAQAPTGIGKTIATIFPTIKSLGEGHISKMFYLTAKTVTRNIAEEAFENLRKRGLRFRTVTLTAKEKVCFLDKVSCKPEDCPYAEGYYDRVDTAMEDIFKTDNYNKTTLLEYSKKHRVCPFEFSLDLSLFCDGIICDYNYVFDPRVYLKRFFLDVREDYAFLIDEAHNLVDRSREMYSAELLKSSFLSIKNELGKEDKKLKKSVSNINSFFIILRKTMEDSNSTSIVKNEPPEEINELLEKFVECAEEFLSRGGSYSFRDRLLELYFDSLNFIRTLEGYDEKYVTYYEKGKGGGDIKLKLFCVDPSSLVGEAMKRGKSSILFSATLSPLEYFKYILGGSEEDYRITIKSPFDSSRLCLMIDNTINTRYDVRELSYRNIADNIQAIIEAKNGNYIVFFPSYKYMNEVYNIFSETFDREKIIIQRSSMSEEERDEYLSRFEAENETSLIGFAVMGGVFGEGIDLTGDKLIGAIIIGVGLPQICLERDIIREYFSGSNGMGFEYAYVYPGMNKVLQAAGRVIRTERDKGIVFLIDERFSRSNYLALMPSEWKDIKWLKNNVDVKGILKEFWS